MLPPMSLPMPATWRDLLEELAPAPAPGRPADKRRLLLAERLDDDLGQRTGAAFAEGMLAFALRQGSQAGIEEAGGDGLLDCGHRAVGPLACSGNTPAPNRRQPAQHGQRPSQQPVLRAGLTPTASALPRPRPELAAAGSATALIATVLRRRIRGKQ